MAAKKEPHKRGRPSSFRPEYVGQAKKLALLGMTDNEMAHIFGVTEQTLNNWKLSHTDFFESLKAGKQMADAEVASSLFHRACGYSHEAVKIIVVAGVIERVPYIEHYPPDPTAMIYWLKNRQQKLWRDKRDDGDADKTSATDLLRDIANELPD